MGTELRLLSFRKALAFDTIVELAKKGTFKEII